MSRKLVPLSFAAAILAGTALADAPQVAVDIAPVHSLVARIMEGAGVPRLILPPGASPHEHSLRPSEAAALQKADIVVWMGEELAPWMEHAVASLAGEADVLTLLEAGETTLLETREGALFEKHDDDADEDAQEEHAGHEGHDHGAHDPHAWLSPANASAWLGLIAARLTAADPGNGALYSANAAAARTELDALTAGVNAILDPVRGRSFIVFHDAFQYFEHAFGFPASGAISLSDAADPGPARIAAIQTRIRDEGVVCVLAEPQFNPGLVATVLDGTEVNTGVIDPLGVDLVPGPALYPQLIRNMAMTLAGCL